MEFWWSQCLFCSVSLYFTATASLSSFSRPLCSDHDKSVLLQFKHSFQIDCAASASNPSPYPKTKSWIDGPNADCCLWEGVGCHQETGTVIELDLRGSCLYGSFPQNSTLFRLTRLQRLYLASNDFNYSQIPSEVANLTSLSTLRSYNSNFIGDIPLSITNLTSLQTLGLSGPSTISPQLLLQFPKLHRLTFLSLSGIQLDSEMPSFLANFTGLTFLDLASTSLKGQLPSWFANLTQLQHLYLKDNLLEGPIPQWFSQLSSLEMLDLGVNNLFGNFDMVFRLQDLIALDLMGLGLTFTSPTKKNSSVVFNLLWLGLSDCNLTEFPLFLQNQTALQFLSLHGNNIKGVIPQWLINTTKESLQFADFSSNMLTGLKQPVSVLPWTNLEVLDISDNEWQGALPTPPSSLLSYTAANNMLTGNIPKDICRARFLSSLDLSDNSMSGRVPSCIGEQLGESLELLNLRGNNLSGNIPSKFTDVCTLKMINFSENKLKGDLPRSLSTCTMLEILDVGKNNLSGNFPSWLGRLPQLQVLVLRHNKFHGSIEDPKDGYEFPFLRIVDLSNNLFIGHLSTVYLQNWQKMQVSDEDNSDSSRSVIDFHIGADTDAFVDIAHLDYSVTITNKGSETLYTKILTVFRVIDFSSNKFTGKIPDVIGDLVGLQALNLSNNNLVGEIPSTLANMTDLESLDLSMNMLTGELPWGLSHLKSLEVFNVSYNHLRGQIPQGEQFNTFDNSSYKGNTELCGNPVSKNCNKVDATLPLVTSDKRNDDSQLIDWIVRSFGCLSGFIIGYVIGKLYITDKYHEWFTEKFQSRPKKRVARKSSHRR